jgi:hypothetical protein
MKRICRTWEDGYKGDGGDQREDGDRKVARHGRGGRAARMAQWMERG